VTADLEAAVAAHGLRGTSHVLPDAPLDAETWAALLADVRSDRLVGLLGDAVATEAFPTTAQQYEDAGEAHLEAMDLAVRLEQVLVDLADRLAQEDVPVRVLKGPAIAHRFYPDPSLRAFGDIDLLVPSEHFDRAVRVVAVAGGNRQHPQPRPGFDRRFSKGTSFFMDSAVEVDLHRTFVSGPFGLTIDLDDVWRESWQFALGDVALQALDLETCLLNLCYHAALGDAVPRLISLRDIVQIIESDDPDAARVVALAQRWGGGAVVARAVTTALRELRVESSHPLAAWAGAYRTDRRTERLLAMYTRPGNAYPGQALAAVRSIPGLPAKASYLRAIVWPDRSYVSPRYRSRLERWGRALRTIGRLYRQD